VFAPEASEIYGPGFSTYVTVEVLSEGLEGASRLGHFRGVTTVVAILFNTIRPDMAFFGQKDAQQAAVISRMSKDLGFDTEIVELPTVREESGLAMSSRNELLPPEDRDKAAIIFQSLRDAKIAFKKGERSASNLSEIVQNEIASVPGTDVDYVAVVDRETFQPIEKIDDREAYILAAARIGGIRLIDNILLNRRQ
jgi:pantoate--beta-alanine ligase